MLYEALQDQQFTDTDGIPREIVSGQWYRTDTPADAELIRTYPQLFVAVDEFEKEKP